MPTELPGVMLVGADVYRDARGFFLEVYHAEKYRGGRHRPAASCRTTTRARGAARCAACTPRSARRRASWCGCVSGEIFDVAVDIRRGSPTFARWVGVVLSAENFRQLYVPPGFVHGFCVLSESADVEYKCTGFYDRRRTRSACAGTTRRSASTGRSAIRCCRRRTRAAPLLRDVVERLPPYASDGRRGA